MNWKHKIGRPRERVRALLEAEAGPWRRGERLLHWAYGVRHPNLVIWIALLTLGLLPGLIYDKRVGGHFFVGLSDRRLLLMRVDRKAKRALELSQFALGEQPPCAARMGVFSVRLSVGEWRARFARNPRMRDNIGHARAIARALTAPPRSAEQKF